MHRVWRGSGGRLLVLLGRKRVGPGERGASIDDLVDRAVEAINRGDRAAATALAGQVLAVDRDNADAEDLRASCGMPP